MDGGAFEVIHSLFAPGPTRYRERIGQGPIGQFAPGSELAWERKGSVPFEVSMAVVGRRQLRNDWLLLLHHERVSRRQVVRA